MRKWSYWLLLFNSLDWLWKNTQDKQFKEVSVSLLIFIYANMKGAHVLIRFPWIQSAWQSLFWIHNVYISVEEIVNLGHLIQIWTPQSWGMATWSIRVYMCMQVKWYNMAPAHMIHSNQRIQVSPSRTTYWACSQEPSLDLGTCLVHPSCVLRKYFLCKPIRVLNTTWPARENTLMFHDLRTCQRLQACWVESCRS